MDIDKEKQLANLIINSSLNISENENVYIKYKSESSINLIKELSKEIINRGACVYTKKYNPELEDYLMSLLTKNNIDSVLEVEEHDFKKYDCFISIGSNDRFVTSPKTNLDVLNEYKRKKRELLKYKKGKEWLILNYPSIVDAEMLNMSYRDYYNYSMDSMLFDFRPLMDSIDCFRDLLSRTEYIRIVGDNVELEFYKSSIPAISLTGRVNLPDGEVYTSPIKDSVNGYIKYNVSSPKNGLVFRDIYLKFKDGKVIDFDCKDHKDDFENIISIDEGSRYIGEFAFGINPMIKSPMNDILYDEKLCKSFHIALGNAYRNAFNGNTSALHWDMVYLNELGNYCDIYFDNNLVYSKGIFIPEKIRKLNK